MADIFISYKSERRAAAEHLAEILADYGYSVWWDYALLSGGDFGAQIERQIRSAKAVVVLWCSLSRDSEWVKEEAALAKRLGKIIPTRIEMIDLPLGFSMAHTLDLMDWDGSPHGGELDRLVGEIARLVGRKPKLNHDGLNRTERAWRRFGAPALRDFALIDELERKRPARTLPSALNRTPREAKRNDGAESNQTYKDSDPHDEDRREQKPAWDLRASAQALWLRFRAIPIPLNKAAITSYIAASVVLFGAAFLLTSPKAKTPANAVVTAPPNGGPTKPPAPAPAPDTTTPPPHVTPPARPPDPSITALTQVVAWKVCNRSSHASIRVAIGYIADDDAADSNVWTFDGWWEIAKGECGIVKRTKSQTLLLRGEASDSATVWVGEKNICILSAKYSNYMVPVKTGSACPRGYESATATRYDAKDNGIFPIDLEN